MSRVVNFINEVGGYSAHPRRTRRLRGEFVFRQNSTAETPSTPRLRREKHFPDRLNQGAAPIEMKADRRGIAAASHQAAQPFRSGLIDGPDSWRVVITECIFKKTRPGDSSIFTMENTR